MRNKRKKRRNGTTAHRTGLGVRSSFVVFFLSLVFGLRLAAQNPEPLSFHSRQVEQGLPQNSVTAMLQTRDGYMWIATFGGLARFDGVRFTVFNHENTPAITGNRFVELHEARDGSLWAGSETGTVARYANGEWTEYGPVEGLPPFIIHDFEEDAEGTMWVAALRGLLGLRGGRFVALKGFENVWVRRLFLDGGRLCFTTEAGVFEVRGDKAAPVRGFPREPVSTVFRDSSGRLWLAHFKRLIRVEPNGDARTIELPFDRDEISGILGFAEDRDRNVLVALQKTVFRVAPDGNLSRIPLPEAVLETGLRSVCCDREGNLWLGTFGNGLLCLSDGVAKSHSTAGATNSRLETKALFADGRGVLWIGVEGKLLSMKNGRLAEHRLDCQAFDQITTAVCGDRDGGLWVSVPRETLRLTPNGADAARGPKKRSYLEFEQLALFSGRDGTLWIGTLAGGLFTYRDGVYTAMGPTEDLPRRTVRTILEDRDGSLWLATDGGLGRFADGRFSFLTTKDGLSSDFTRALHFDSDGALWVGTYGGGLNRFKDGRFTAVTTSDGLFDNVVSCILEDDQGNFWMSGNRGIFRAAKRDLNDFAEGKIGRLSSWGYDKADGLLTSESNGGFQPAGAKTPDGRLWFPMVKGIVSIDPGKLNRRSPSVYVEEVTVDGRTASPAVPATFEAGSRRFDIRYTALSFVVPQKVRFKYKLEGADPDWIDAGTERSARYTNLPPGDYRFRVVACNNDGIWNETGATLEFTLKPYFYQTRWFFALCGLGVFGLGIGINALRVHRLQARTRRLEAVVAERTETIRLEKERTEAALVETQAARVEAEFQKRQADQANEVKTNLLNIAAHDLKNPLHAVKGFSNITAQTLKDFEIPPECLEYLSVIDRESERMLTLVNELLETAVLESGELRLHKRRIDAGTLALGVVEGNRPQAEAKNQTIHFTTERDCFVEVDPERFCEAMDNLVSNAVKYSPRGKPIFVSVTNGGATVRFAVRDEGPGLTEKDKKLAFGKFQRLSAEPTADEPSTGLGLSIVKQLVELHGGRVWVESEAGRGSTFTIEVAAVSKSFSL